MRRAAAPPRAAVQTVLRLRGALLRAADAVFPPQFALFEHTVGLYRSQLIGAVVELGVADALARRGRATAAELAAALDLDAGYLHRVLRALAVYRIVRLDRRGRFALTRMGRRLASDHPESLAAWVRYAMLPATQAAWAAIADAVRTGEPPFPRVNGQSVWARFAEHPSEQALFASAMRQLTDIDIAPIVGGYPWPERGTVCDVAGGTGTLLAAILARRPHARGVLVDAPAVLRDATAGDRVTLAPGDIFERVEATADVYVLKDILHDWDDAACARILATVRRAMPPGSRLVLVERPQDPNVVDPITSLEDVQMLTQCDGGRQRSVAELQALLRGAGLAPGAVRRTGGPTLLEGLAS